jgi:hypothetical protein
MSTKKEYTETELNSLIADVSREFTTHLAKAEKDFNLAKSEEKSEDKPKEKDEAKASEESKGEPEKKMESEKPEDKGVEDQHQQDNSKDEPKGDKPESKEERVAEDGKENSKPSDDAHGDAEDHGYDDEDMQHMHSMYSSMSRGELKAHHDAVRKAMDGHGLAKCEDGMAKSEKDVVIEIAQDQEVSLLKSELEAVKAKSEDRQKNLEAVEAFLKKFVEKTAPAGKAITSLDIIAKTEGALNEKPLSKSEIDAKLLIKAKDQSLSKSDRDAINSYYFSKKIETVSHLLK